MRSAVVIVVEVRREDPLQVPIMEHDNVVEAFSANRSDQAFAIGILPGRSSRNDHFVNAHVLDPFPERFSVASVAVSEQIPRGLVEWKGFRDLLRRPQRRRMGRDVEMDHFPTVVPEHDQYVKDTKRGRWHGEEVDGRQVGDMVVQERALRLRGWFAGAYHVLGDGLFGHIMAQQAEFRFNPRCAPGWILPGHPSNQITDLLLESWSARLAGSRFPTPIQPKTLSMPTDDRVWLNDHKH